MWAGQKVQKLYHSKQSVVGCAAKVVCMGYILIAKLKRKLYVNRVHKPLGHPCTYNYIVYYWFSSHMSIQKFFYLEQTINDVITGVVFLGTRLYMEATSSQSGNARTTSLVMLNTRLIDGYRSVDEMLYSPKAQNLWGNQFGFIQVSVPKLNQSDDQSLNPLKFVYEAHNIISQKRNSWGIYLTGMLLESIRKYRGTPVCLRLKHISFFSLKL